MIIMGPNQKKRTQNKRQSINHAILIVHEKWDGNERFRRPHVWNQHKSNHYSFMRITFSITRISSAFSAKRISSSAYRNSNSGTVEIMRSMKGKKSEPVIFCVLPPLLALQPSKTLKFCFLYVPFVIHFQRVLTVAFLSQRLSLSLFDQAPSYSRLPYPGLLLHSHFSSILKALFFPFLEKKN